MSNGINAAPKYCWDDRMLQFVTHSAVEDRTVRFQKHRNVFIGSETVDSLVYHKLVRSRREAVIVGRILMRDYGLFHHVATNGQLAHDFRDDSSLFYRFDYNVVLKYLPDVSTAAAWMINGFLEGSISSAAPTSIAGDDVSALPTPTVAGKDQDVDSSGAAATEAAIDESFRSSSTGSVAVNRPTIFIQEEGLSQKAKSFLRIAEPRDRYYHMRKYPQVFVGSEVVTALVEQGVCQTRSEAVQLGRQLERDLCLFHHVVNEHRFADEFYFYQYYRNNRMRALLLKETQHDQEHSQTP